MHILYLSLIPVIVFKLVYGFLIVFFLQLNMLHMFYADINIRKNKCKINIIVTQSLWAIIIIDSIQQSEWNECETFQLFWKNMFCSMFFLWIFSLSRMTVPNFNYLCMNVSFVRFVQHNFLMRLVQCSNRIIREKKCTVFTVSFWPTLFPFSIHNSTVNMVLAHKNYYAFGNSVCSISLFL